MAKYYFIQILSDYLNGTATVLPEVIDWATIGNLTRIHQVDGIIFCQCKNMMPSDKLSSFRQAYYQTIGDNIKRLNAICGIEELLRENKIPFFMVKGIKVKEYYPVPALRTMGDADLVVHPEDRNSVHELLIQNGFLIIDQHKDQSWHYSKNGLTYELHDRLVYDAEINYPALRQFFNNCWDYVNDEVLDVSFHFLFLLSHLRTHLMGYGVGLRQFMDIAVMAKEEQNLNWPWIREKLVELELMKFASTCFALIDRWFDIKIPLERNELDEDFYLAATNNILSGGVFGFHNPDSSQNITINAVRGSRLTRLAMLKKAMATVFPSYKTLSDNDNYRFIDGRPWLLPAAWGYRLYRGFGLLTQNRKAVKFLYASKSAVQARDKYLSSWGL